MARKATAAPAAAAPAKASVPAVVEEKKAGLPAHLASRMIADSGKGVSTASDDNIVPLIYVLQPLSPQVDPRSPEFIEGAKAGDIWLKNAPAELAIISGEVGVRVQPCHFGKDFVEWIPRVKGGGYVNRFDDKPEDTETKPDPNDPERTRDYRPNGNEIIETRYHAVNVYLDNGIVLPYVIPLSGTGHTVSRQWMFAMNSKAIRDPGTNRQVPVPSFACFYHMKTKQKQNKKGRWFVLDLIDDGWVDDEGDYDRGSRLHASFASGERRADTPDAAMHGEAAAGGDDNAAM